MVKILHTSDWHLGRSLYDYSRYDEFQQFLDYLYKLLIEQEIEVLLICGDIFDTQTPSHKSQELYYKFLSRLNTLEKLEHVVIVGGNHDSPSFLNAAKSLLSSLNIHIISAFSGDLHDEMLILKDKDGQARLIVAAVPFLRNRDVRVSEFNEDQETRNLNLKRGIAEHYEALGKICQEEATKYSPNVPIIGIGHLALTSSQSIALSQSESIYIGTLDMLPADIIPKNFAYTALGHIHKNQEVTSTIHYCGCPLQLNFNEAYTEKYLNLIELDAKLKISKIKVPIFQRLESLKGNSSELLAQLQKLIAEDEKILVELNYNGKEPVGNLYDKAQELSSNSKVEVLAVRDLLIRSKTLQRQSSGEILANLSVNEVFERCLDDLNLDEEEQKSYQNTFKEIYTLFKEQN